MTAYASTLELELGSFQGHPPRMIRFYAARLIAELGLGRRLSPEEAKRLGSKIYASYPRVNGGHIYRGEEPASCMEVNQAILTAIDRAGLGSEEDQRHGLGSVAGEW